MNDKYEKIDAEFVVVGGGIAGCTAAIAAARLGVKTALIQNRPVLGGNASSEIGLVMAGADRDFTHARETGIIEEIDLLNRYHNYEVQWRNCISDATLEALVKSSGVNLYLNSHVHDIVMSDETNINSVIASQQGTENLYCFSAPFFVDATGDGSLAVMSNAIYRIGTESKDEFGESLASDTPSATTMGSTLMFRVKQMDTPIPFNKMAWAYEYLSPESLPVKIRSLEYPQLWIEYGAKLDTIKDNMAIRDELLKILYGVWDHVKNHGDYGAEDLALSWVGSVPGKRESRRMEGDYILTQDDLENPRKFEDAVAYGGWPIDVHNPDGFYAKKKWLDYTHLNKPYTIPYRCYYSKNIENLFMTGRNISASHVAHGSTRLIRTCAVGGQAVGTAAYLCNKYKMTPREIGKSHIKELQQTLLKYDCFIPDIKNEDNNDLAQNAVVTASSEYCEPNSKIVHSASKVIDGVSRGNVKDENMWISKPLTHTEETYIELKWKQNVTLNSLHLTFDTMIREQRFFDKKILGAIKTCVKKFVIEYRDAGKWITLQTVEGNFLRHRIIKFRKITTPAIRVKIIKTNGDPQARIYEIRAYNE